MVVSHALPESGRGREFLQPLLKERTLTMSNPILDLSSISAGLDPLLEPVRNTLTRSGYRRDLSVDLISAAGLLRAFSIVGVFHGR